MEGSIALKAGLGFLVFGSIAYFCLRQFFRVATPKFLDGVGFATGLYFAVCTLLLPAYFIHLQERDEPSFIPPLDVRYLAATAWAQLHNTIIFFTADAVEFEVAVNVIVDDEPIKIRAVAACVGRHAVSTGKLVELHYFRSIRTISGAVGETTLESGRWAGFRLAADKHCPYQIDRSRRFPYPLIDENWAIPRAPKLSVLLIDEKRPSGTKIINLTISNEWESSEASVRFLRMTPVRKAFARADLAPFKRDEKTFP